MSRIKWTKDDVIRKIQDAIFELEKPLQTSEELMARALPPEGVGGTEGVPTEGLPFPEMTPPAPPI